MKKALVPMMMAEVAKAQNASEIIKVKIEEPPLLGFITRELLVKIIIGLFLLYLIIVIIRYLRRKRAERAAALISERERTEQLKAEKAKLERMIEGAKKSYYKRELSEEEAKKLMFEYRQRILEIDGELKEELKGG